MKTLARPARKPRDLWMHDHTYVAATWGDTSNEEAVSVDCCCDYERDTARLIAWLTRALAWQRVRR